MSKLSDYVNLFCDNNLEQYIHVFPRFDSNKGKFLLVNDLLCKHVPCPPSKFAGMCSALSSQLTKYNNIMLIGLSENATALARMVAHQLGNKVRTCLVTTREIIPNSIKIASCDEDNTYFTYHSLCIPDNMTIDWNNYDVIIFLDDVVTTGENFQKLYEDLYTRYNIFTHYAIASICNLASVFADGDAYFLVKGQELDNTKKPTSDWNAIEEYTDADAVYRTYQVPEDNVFLLEHTVGYTGKSLERAYEYIRDIAHSYGVHTIRIVGTEEFMYLPIQIGAKLEEEYTVICHATTSAAIDSNNRIQLTSPYDAYRTTYIYNTEAVTDLVVAITDSPNTFVSNMFFDDVYNIFKNKTKLFLGVKM